MHTTSTSFTVSSGVSPIEPKAEPTESDPALEAVTTAIKTAVDNRIGPGAMVGEGFAANMMFAALCDVFRAGYSKDDVRAGVPEAVKDPRIGHVETRALERLLGRLDEVQSYAASMPAISPVAEKFGAETRPSGNVTQATGRGGTIANLMRWRP